MKISDNKFFVTFNTGRNEYSTDTDEKFTVGDEHMSSIDYVGNDLEELLTEVLEDDDYFTDSETDESTAIVRRYGPTSEIVIAVGHVDDCEDEFVPTFLIVRS